MKRYTLILVFVVLGLILNAQAETSNINISPNTVDSIKNIFEINDSIVVLFNEYTADDFFHIIFIDYNLNSMFHERLKKRKNPAGSNDSILIQIPYEKYIDKGNIINVSFPENLYGYWYQIRKMDGEFYLHSPCCFAPVDRICDSMFINDNMMGGEPFFLSRFLMRNGTYYISTYKQINEDDFAEHSIILKPVDKSRMIYLYKDDSKCEYLIHESKINTVPIIQEYCNMKTFPNTLKFDEIICE